jgi:MFS family permease
MVATHPDHAAGLGFVGNSVFAFGPILFAQGALLSGWIADRVVRSKLTVLDFKVEIVLLVGVLVGALLLPLAVFLPKLADAKRRGRRQYGLLASRYTTAFERKWIKGEAATDEPLLGTADIQSLADLGNSYQQVQDTRLLPFGMSVVSNLMIMTAIPLLPLIFTVLSLDSMVMRLFKILF